MRALALAVVLVFIAQAASARVIEVGPTRALATPSAAAAVARDGDVVRIDAGDYRDCAIWRANDLTLEGVGGPARMHGVTCANQAIWLILGSRITVRRIGFVGARATFGNGAGIKFMGTTLAVEDSEFRDNENGILARGEGEGTVRIARSRFVGNGRCLKDCAHGIYIGPVAKLTIADSLFRAQSIGHHIKSRALLTEIEGNRIEDGPQGTASYAIDLPNAGTAFILRNRIEKGPMSENFATAIAIGAEGARNPSSGIYIAGNSFRNDNPKLQAFVRSYVPGLRVEMSDNRFAGIAAAPFRFGPPEPKN
jgi:nitrous oxidase accessory protein NosD